MKNILIAHGGGPTAVINSSLQGIIEAARESGQVGRIYAARHGVEGILKGDLIDLTDVPAETVRRLAHTPASAIGSCRRKLGEADYPVILQCLKKHEIDCFFYNGGNDSMDTCQKIHAMALREGLDLRVIGIPKTMDNDLAVTDHCPGFGSAARYAAVNAAELALDAAALPIHVIVLELMGRNAGWVTAASAWASRATHCEQLVCLPEQPVDEKKLLAAAERRFAKGKGLLICVSEGVCGMDGKPLASTGIVDGFGHPVAGGTAQYLADRLMQELGVKVVEDVGEAAFYGPKVDINAKNVYGKEDTMITVQWRSWQNSLTCIMSMRTVQRSVRISFTVPAWDAMREHLHG